MQRAIYIVCGILTAGLVAVLAWRVLFDPIGDDRAWIEEQVAAIEPPDGEIETLVKLDHAKLRSAVVERENLWDELIKPPPPPPKPPPAPPPPPKPPDLGQFLKGVQATTQSIGSKVKVITPENARGEFLQVGDMYKNLKITAITDSAVTFSMEWRGQTLSEDLPRQ